MGATLPPRCRRPEPSPTVTRPTRVLRTRPEDQVMSLPPRVRRSVTVIGVTAGLVGAFAAGTAVTGGDDPGSDTRPRPRGGTDASPVAFTGSNLSLAESCDDLLDWYVARGVDRVGPWGWDYGYGFGDVVMADGAAARRPRPAPAANSVTEQRSTFKAPAPLAATSRVENDDSGTNVQELGVDEPDVVKTDGRTLFRVEGNDLVTYDVTGAEVERIGSADLVDLRYGEILLAGDTVVAIGSSAAGRQGVVRRPRCRPGWSSSTSPTRPPRRSSTPISTARPPSRHGCTATRSDWSRRPGCRTSTSRRPAGTTSARPSGRTARSSASRRIDDWLPTVSTDGGDPERLVECEDVAIPTDGDSLGTIAVVGFAADEPGDAQHQRPRGGHAARLRLGRQALPGHVRLGLRRLLRLLRRRRLRRPALAPGRRGQRRRRQPPLRVRPRRPRDDVRRLRPGRRDDPGPLGDGRGRRRPAGGGRAHRRRPATSTRSSRSARTDNDLVEAGRVDELGVERGDPVDALVRRAGHHGDLPAGRPALRDRPDRPGRAEADGAAQDPRLLGVPAPARPAPAARARRGTDRRRARAGARRPGCSTSRT